MRPLNRPIAPVLPVGAYKTYEIDAPMATHWRAASCAEVACGAYLRGWRTVVDEHTPLGLAQASYIRRDSGRGFREERNEGGMTVFTFEAGQRCFKADEHRIKTGQPELFSVRGGDYRGSTGRIHTFARAADWTDDFADHQQRIADRINQG